MTEAKEPLGHEMAPGNYRAWCSAYADAAVKRPTSSEMLEVIDAVVVQKHASARAIAAITGNVFSKEAMREIVVLEETHRLLVVMKANFADFPTKVQKILRREE